MPVSKCIDSLSESEDDVGPKSMKAMKVVKAKAMKKKAMKVLKAMKAMKSRMTGKKPVKQTRRTKAGVWEPLLSHSLLDSLVVWCFLPDRI